MNKDHDLSSLREAAQVILAEDSSIQTWIPAIRQLEEIVNRHTPFRLADQNIADGETRLPGGLAVSPTQAALCLREISRTAMFIKGLAGAIRKEMSKVRKLPVRVLYAGCGPYALLSLPLMTVFTPQEVNFTLLEIHKEALESARTLIESLGLLSYVGAFVCADAAAYRIENNSPHIIISETMNACLGREPQISIVRNLIRQAPDAVLIPQSVTVNLYLLDPSKEHVLVSSDHVGDIPEPVRDRLYLGKVFELNKQTINDWANIQATQLPGFVVQMPARYGSHYKLYLLTDITVYDKARLKDYDCSLTYPRKMKDMQKIRGGERLSFEYVLGSNPGLVYKVVKNGKIKNTFRRLMAAFNKRKGSG